MRLIWVMFFSVLQSTSFKTTQLQHVRVKDAYTDKESVVKKYFDEKKLSYQKFNIFIRAFKQEQQLEVWIKPNDAHNYILLHTYDICANSGHPGPKRKEGDYQVPEGIYQITHFNPFSNFHLSLGINYPNASDKILSDRKNPGGAIYIHGNCVTVGCIPLTDDKIKELYILAVEARNNGQQNIPVHIYPCKLDDRGLSQLTEINSNDSDRHTFWKNLQLVYTDFENSKTLKPIHINKKGEYHF